jgi:tRNA-dihydrouridine synthase
MIGRAAPANPWIFRQIAQYTATGVYDRATEMDRYRMIKTYFGMLVAELGEHPPLIGHAETDAAKRQKRDHESAQREAIGKMKQFASWFTHGVAGGGALRRAIFESKNGVQVMDAVERFFEGKLAAEADEPEPEEMTLEALGKDCD